MRLLFYLPNYLPYTAGDTLMVRDMIRYMKHEHEITIMLQRTEPYEWEGVNVVPRSASSLNQYDAVFCQLDTTKETIQLCSKPIFYIQHNTFSRPSVENNISVNVIANSEHGAKQFPKHDVFVLPPPVDPDYYAVQPGDCITIINCNENKGGKIVHEIAKRMPKYKFLQVIGGYGTQFVSIDGKSNPINIDNRPVLSGLGRLDNVYVVDNQQDIREVYKRTKILLMPSLYETWGRTATEAMCSGIPVIASHVVGLKENIGIGGIFVQRDYIKGWIMEIERLQGKDEYEKASEYAKKRADELRPIKKLEQLNNWIKKKVYGVQSDRR